MYYFCEQTNIKKDLFNKDDNVNRNVESIINKRLS